MFLYSLKQGFKNIWHNKIFSLASIATMTACIFLFGLFFAIVTNFQAMVKEAEAGVAVTVYFDEGITDVQVQSIGDQIKKRPEVSEVKYISAQEAWESFKQEYFEGSESAAESFAGDNPLANYANYEIYLSDVSMQETLVTYLESIDGVSEVNQSEVVANTLSDFNRLVAYVSMAVIIILLGVAVFLINNTVSVGIAVRREEIGIMKLIGANNSFIRAPFMIEGMLIGLLGSIIPMVILYYLYNNITVYIDSKFSFLSRILTFVPVNSVFRILVPVALVLGVGIGFIGSILTMRRHLDV